MPKYASGLIITPSLTQRNVTVDLKFQPSVGILARKVDKLGADIRSFREPLHKAVKQIVIPSIRRNFDSGGRPPWEPLADWTVKHKGHARILYKTGSLRRVMGQINVWTIDREKAMITDLPDKVWYGKVHQAGATFAIPRSSGSVDQAAIDKALSYKGTRVGRRDSDPEIGEIPARPFVVLQTEDMEAIEHIFQEWVGDKIRQAGLA